MLRLSDGFVSFLLSYISSYISSIGLGGFAVGNGMVAFRVMIPGMGWDV